MNAHRHPAHRPDSDWTSSNPSDSTALSDIIGRRVGRRAVLAGGIGAMATTLFGDRLATAQRTAPAVASRPVWPVARPATTAPSTVLGFAAVAPSTADAVVVPEGYVAQVLIPWGTPMQSSGPAFKPDGSNTAAEQAQQVGANHDGMFLFPIEGKDPNVHGLLVVNHEYTDLVMLFADGGAAVTPESVDKALQAHGVTVIEVELADGSWKTVDSPLNRRITVTTPVAYSGPVSLDVEAMVSNNGPMGTLNNCGAGMTPWGTYLTCEENWHQYFGTADEEYKIPVALKRYGVSNESEYPWHTVDPRWDVAKNPNEPNRFGWVVEIDPADAASLPTKRTALGRFKHESAWVTETNGVAVVYSGDDQDGEYLYKFVSSTPWKDAVAAKASPLDEGTLYVARFNDDGSGEWLALVWGQGSLSKNGGFADQADLLIRTREAADRVGATKLDRPEWIAQNPLTGDLYVSLTNGTQGANPVNPRSKNVYGHIVHWAEAGGDHTATTFAWDVFVLAGDPSYDDQVTITGDMFGSPDGLWADPDGRLWIETDVSNSAQLVAEKGFDKIGNNQLLAADLTTGEIRRFLVGPRGCEITGLHTTPDRTSMFVNVQHPGEASASWGEPTADKPGAVSTWPDGAGRPRSATVVIRKADGGVIGA